MKLTKQQLQEFDQAGYLFLEELFSEERLSKEEAQLLKREANTAYTSDRKDDWRETTGVADNVSLY